MTDTSVTSWLKTHERIVIVALCLGLGAFGIGKFFDVEAARKDVKYVAAQQAIVEAQKNSAALASQAAQTQAQYTALVQVLSAQNASLAASIAQRTASGTAQRAIDATSALPALASRWNEVASTTVIVAEDTVTVSNTDAHKTVDLIEQVPVLSQNLADETKVAQNYQAELEKSDLLLSNYGAQITGLNTQIVDQTKACVAQVAAVKAEGRKGKVKWFKIGFVSGFLSGLWAGHSGL